MLPPPTELVFRAEVATGTLACMENEGLGPPRPIAAVELEAVRNLEPQLKDHLQANSDVCNFIGLVLGGAPDARLADVTQARKVTTCLLVRIANDLRCIGLVSVRGYADQACALAPSVYEAAFAIIAIGEDEGLAQEWIDHPDPNHLFRPIRDLTLMGMKSLGILEPEQQAKRWYAAYSQLCMAKHLNPLLQATRGFRVQANRVLVVTGPDTSQESVRLAWFALEHSAGLALTAAGFFGQKYVRGSRQRELAAASRELQELVGNLRAAAVARGWDKNPFPDYWKIHDAPKI
jgi:hypothetical protein